MDPCPFVRLTVDSLAVKLHTAGDGAATPTKCFVKLKLANFPSQTTVLPITGAAPTTTPLPESFEGTAAASFDVDPETLRRSLSKKTVLTLKLSVYAGKRQSAGLGTCGAAHARGKKLLGSVQVCVNLGGESAAQSRGCVYHSGWMKLDGGSGNAEEPFAKLHATVRSEPDPRYMFQFGGEPESSPVVYQIQANNSVRRQPVFSCKFADDRNSNRARSLPSDFNSTKKTWLRRTFFAGKHRAAANGGSRRERKGWMVIIYDLSGSAVAAASMVTPFVPSPNSDSVSRSNPGAWLVLRPNSGGWKPWGRLEAWRQKGRIDSALGYRFDLVDDDTGLSGGAPIAEGKISARKGGEFRIDDSKVGLGCSPSVRGFVMSAAVDGEGRASEPTVRIAARYVTCMADAALFVALSAAVDLSMDACRVFS